VRAFAALALLAGAARADGVDPAKTVEAALIAAEPKLHRCWEQAAADDYRVEGQMSVRVVVGDGGAATAVDPRDDTTRKPALVACVRAAFAGVRLDGFAPGDSIEIPVVFKAEPNRTVRAADVTPWSGGRLSARVLIDGRSAGADQASLVLFDVAPGGEVKLPPCDATVVLIVADGQATAAKQALAIGDAVVAPPRAPVAIASAAGARLVALYAPPGAEARYRGGRIAAVKPAGAAAVHTAAAAATHALAGGKGRVRLVVDDVAAAYAGWIELVPGAAVSEHTHGKEAELLYVLAGGGEMTVDGQTYPVEPGMAVHVPAGATHGFRVTSTMPVEAVQFYAPAGPQQRFKGPPQ
jgi:quercetin dioxygenase-like cupin family protein